MSTLANGARNEDLTEISEGTPGHSHCPRCQGLLVTDQFMDMEQGGFMWGCGWRCVNCGNIVFASPAKTREPEAPVRVVDDKEGAKAADRLAA